MSQFHGNEYICQRPVLSMSMLDLIGGVNELKLDLKVAGAYDSVSFKLEVKSCDFFVTTIYTSLKRNTIFFGLYMYCV